MNISFVPDVTSKASCARNDIFFPLPLFIFIFFKEHCKVSSRFHGSGLAWEAVYDTTCIPRAILFLSKKEYVFHCERD